MKSNFILILLLMSAFSCSKKSDFKSMDTFISKTKSSKGSREVAQANTSACFEDKLTENKLLREIKELENNRAAGPKYILNGIDLSKFQASEAIFLDKNKEWIQTSDLDFSSCTDVKCVFSRIYPNSNGLEGYIHYYFYLKMGYALNTVKSIPGIALDRFTYADVLFSQEELQNFYYLSKIVSPKHQKLPTLSSIHRLPKNQYHPSYGEKSCGLAGGPLNKGYVILMDKCLNIVEKSILSLNFVPLTTHELSHRLDLHLNKNYISQTQEWLDLTGWEIKEDTDQNTGRVIKRTWNKKTSSSAGLTYDGFFRQYTGTDPGEDFADSIGFFRSNPVEMKKVAPKKFKWITENIYNGKSYTPDGLSNAYYDYLLSYGMSNIPVITERCLTDKTSFTYQNDLSVLASFQKYDAALIQCIFGGLEDSVAQGVQTLKADEVEACDYFKSSDKTIRNKVFQGLVDFVKSDLDKNIEIKTQLLLLSELMGKITEEIDPRELFITCQEESKPSDCFNKTITTRIAEMSSDYEERLPNQVKSLATTYLKDNSYDFVQSKVVELFSQIFLGSEIAFKKEAERKWKLCKNSKNIEEGTLALQPFTGETQYMKSSILNCVNTNAESELSKILDKAAGKLGVTIANESIKKFVLNMYLTSYTSTLIDLSKKEVETEKIKATQIRNVLSVKVSNSLSQNTDWLTGESKFEEDIFQSCIIRAKSLILTELQTSYKNDIENLSYHSASDFMIEDLICTEVKKSSRLRQILQNNRDRAFNQSLKVLGDKVIQLSAAHVDCCKKQFTKRDTIAAKNRKSCLTKKWKTITDKALQAWSAENEYTSTQRKLGSRYLDDEKSDLQEQVIKTMEAR
jgi:hypothetical protein